MIPPFSNSTARSVLVFISLAFSACTDTTGLDQSARDTFGGPLEFAVYEDVARPPAAPTAPYVTLEVETTKPVSCGTTLEARVDVSERRITVDLVGLRPPSQIFPCAAIAQYAGFQATLPVAAGLYDLQFEFLGVPLRRYELQVSEASINLSAPSVLPGTVLGPMIEPRLTTAWRVPPRSFWVECYVAEEPSVCEALVRELTTSLPLTPLASPGTGWGPWTSFPSFVYGAEADFMRATDIMCSFGFGRPERYMTLWLRNWEGRTALLSRVNTRYEGSCVG